MPGQGPAARFLASKIRDTRRGRGWTTQQVADEMRRRGLAWTRTTVTKLELGRREVSVDELVALADVFGFLSTELLPDDVEPPSVATVLRSLADRLDREAS